MTDKPTPTDAELKAMWQLHAADIGGIFYYARAVLAKWGQPAQATKCECTLAQRCTGSGCRYCNPQEYIDMLHEQIADVGAAQAAEPVAELHVDRFTTAIKALQGSHNVRPYGKHSLYTAPQPVAREPLTDGQIEDLLICGNPTDEEMRLIRTGWDAAHGIKGGQHAD